MSALDSSVPTAALMDPMNSRHGSQPTFQWITLNQENMAAPMNRVTWLLRVIPAIYTKVRQNAVPSKKQKKLSIRKNNWQEIGDAGKEKFDLWHVPTQRAQRVLNTIYAK